MKIKEQSQLPRVLFSQSFKIDLNSPRVISSDKVSSFCTLLQEEGAAYIKAFFALILFLLLGPTCVEYHERAGHIDFWFLHMDVHR